MKTRILIAGAVLIALFATQAILAQEAKNEEQDFSKVLVQLKTKGGLDKEQDAEVSRLFREYRDKREEILAKFPEAGTEDRLARRIELRRLNRETSDAVQALLKEDQLETFHKIAMEHRKENRSESRDKMRDERINEMVQELGLTEEQVARVVPILDERSEKMRILMDKNRGRGREALMDSRGDVKKIQEDADQKIEKVLTPEQMEKYKKLVKRWRERNRPPRGGRGDRGDRGGRGGPGGGGPGGVGRGGGGDRGRCENRIGR